MEVFLWAKPEAARMKTEINRLLQTGKDCLFVLRLAFAFKLGMLFMQVVFNVLVPDHQGSMEDVEMKTHRHPQHNTLIEALLGGLDNWDAEYYIYIAQHGYTFLQSMAFFPLYPVMIWITSRTLLFPLSLLLADHSLFLLAGSLVNLCAFTLAAVVLYLLTWSVSGNQKFSHLTVVLFCVNPASVFMSAVYTETLFSLFTFAGLYLLTNCHCWAASLVFALASGTRSNGIVLAGFIAYYHLHNLMKTLRLVSLRSILVVCAVQCVVVVLPFLVFQWYSYHKFCHLPGSEGEEVYEWCTWTLPLSYSYIQQHYWNVGFLHYYKWKQIPNFLLALPVVWLSLSALYCHFCTSVGIMRKRCFSDIDMLAYAVHLLFLTGFGVFNMHIQVLTRFLFSSTPLLYWFAAQVLSDALPHLPPTPLSIRHYLATLTKQLLSNEHSLSLQRARLIVLYFLVYVVVGFILHCNFYPWT